jgi:hypothetical protein
LGSIAFRQLSTESPQCCASRSLSSEPLTSLRQGIIQVPASSSPRLAASLATSLDTPGSDSLRAGSAPAVTVACPVLRRLTIVTMQLEAANIMLESHDRVQFSIAHCPLFPIQVAAVQGAVPVANHRIFSLSYTQPVPTPCRTCGCGVAPVGRPFCCRGSSILVVFPTVCAFWLRVRVSWPRGT